jgi:hypothetical protein
MPKQNRLQRYAFFDIFILLIKFVGFFCKGCKIEFFVGLRPSSLSLRFGDLPVRKFVVVID